MLPRWSLSDPIIFGHCVKVLFKDVFAKYGDIVDELKVDVNNSQPRDLPRLHHCVPHLYLVYRY